MNDNNSIQLLGHRQRLRERFLISQKSIPDYELLEMLLFLAFPRKDTKNLAKLLLNKFKNLENIFNADNGQLKSINGIGDGVVHIIKLVQELHLRILKEKIDNTEIKLSNIQSVKQYCKSKIGFLVNEKILVLFLNNSSILIAEEIISFGDSNKTMLSTSSLISKANQNGAIAIILVHNHPSGDPNPSIQDIDMTKNLEKILFQVGIKLLDHIIVSKNKSFSFYESNLLESRYSKSKQSRLSDNYITTFRKKNNKNNLF